MRFRLLVLATALLPTACTTSSTSTPGAGATAAFAADWSSFRDPNEQAFTVDVPPGWTVKGGLFRLGYSDTRPMVDMTSPDGRTNVRLGDVAIPVYANPDQNHREGDTVDLGLQAQMTAAQYRTGQDYAFLYSAAHFKSVCMNPVARTPEAGAPMQDGPTDTPPSQNTSGAAAYRCADGRLTYVYVTTSQFQGFWIVRTLGSYIAPADQATAARNTLIRAASSFKISPPWRELQKQEDAMALEYQRQRQAQRRRILTQQVAEAEMRMQGLARQVESFTKTLSGLTPTIDPLGNRHDVFIGPHNRYWTDGLGHYANSDSSPGPDWRELQQTE